MVRLRYVCQINHLLSATIIFVAIRQSIQELSVFTCVNFVDNMAYMPYNKEEDSV